MAITRYVQLSTVINARIDRQSYVKATDHNLISDHNDTDFYEMENMNSVGNISSSRTGLASNMNPRTAESQRFLIPTTYVLGYSMVIGSTLFTTSAIAQSITLDGSTPTTLSTGIANCAGTCITGGSRDGNGTGDNLFHSFSDFNIGNGLTVTFDDPGVTNIFSRVTGSSASTINGTLSVNSDANLFLLNANGILFGNDAQLDLEGSFLATTAADFVFANNNTFGSSNNNSVPPLLTVNTPIGVQFGNTANSIELTGTGNRLLYSSRGIRRNFFPGPPPGPISGLGVSTGETIALLGGDINFSGSNLIAENGHVEVASLGSNTFVGFSDNLSSSQSNNNSANNSQWQFNYADVSDFKDISFSNLSSIDVSGPDAGSLHVQGRQLSISDGSSLLAQVSNNGGGNINIDATEKLQLTGVNLAPPPNGPFMQSSIYAEIAPTGNGDGSSSITINSPEIDIRDGAQIGLTMAGAGTAGIVDIQNAQTITVEGLSNIGPSSIFTTVAPLPDSSLNAQGGNLRIATEQFTITNGANIAANTFGPGAGGSLTITADTVEVIGFGVANTPTGPLTVPSIIETASLVAPDESIGRPPNTIPNADGSRPGNGSGSSGSATLKTRQLLVAEGGQIRTGTNSNNPAGHLTINATDSVELNGETADGRSGLFSSARAGSGAGGSITINTAELSILNGATIDAGNFPSSATSSRSEGSGPAGDIYLTAQSLLLNNDGLITADTVVGNHANITIKTEDIILRNGSAITTDAIGTAIGGNINIDTTALIALENSDITANAQSNTGGRIIINAQTILGTAFREELTDESDITATSALGPAFSGSVELNTPDVSPTEGLTNLPPNTASTEQIVAACEQVDSNTFVASGRGGVPEDSSQLIVEESVWNDFRVLENLSDSQVINNLTNSLQNNGLQNNGLQNKSEQAHGTKDSLQSNALASDVLKTTELASTDGLPLTEAQTWFTNDQGEIVLGMQAPSSAQPFYQISNCLAEQ